MTADWVLIVSMLSPGGNFLSKYPMTDLTKAECDKQVIELRSIRGPLGQQFNGVCVTKSHWEGKKKMPGMAYD